MLRRRPSHSPLSSFTEMQTACALLRRSRILTLLPGTDFWRLRTAVTVDCLVGLLKRVSTTMDALTYRVWLAGGSRARTSFSSGIRWAPGLQCKWLWSSRCAASCCSLHSFPFPNWPVFIFHSFLRRSSYSIVLTTRGRSATSTRHCLSRMVTRIKWFLRRTEPGCTRLPISRRNFTHFPVEVTTMRLISLLR